MQMNDRTMYFGARFFAPSDRGNGHDVPPLSRDFDKGESKDFLVDHGQFIVLLSKNSNDFSALHEACRLAKATKAHIALVYYIASSDFAHWHLVDDLMNREKRDEGALILEKAASIVWEQCQHTPPSYILEGSMVQKLPELIEFLGSIDMIFYDHEDKLLSPHMGKNLFQKINSSFVVTTK